MKQLTIANVPKQHYTMEEALNRLRVNVGFCGDRFKKIIITSSLPDEGKSFVSFQLWRMLAEAGNKVVLVDADMRKSVLRSRYQITFDESDPSGLARYLSGQSEMEDVLYESNFPNAYMIPTIHTVINPAVLLQNERFDQMMAYLTEHFDYILVDTPPLNNVADGAMIASKCDGAIMAIHSSSTPRKLVVSSLSQLERSGCELMGMVLTRVQFQKNAYYYRYGGYGRYRKYGRYSRYGRYGRYGQYAPYGEYGQESNGNK